MVKQVLLSVGLTPEERTALDDLSREMPDLEVVVVDRIEEALETLRSQPVECLVTVEQLPDAAGLELIEKSRERWPDVGCILCADPDQAPLLSDGGLTVEFVPRNKTKTTSRLTQLARVTVERRTQASYPLPADEAERLAALQRYRLDDDTLVGNIERVTELAALHFDVPLSSVNLIHEHRFEQLACHGGTPTEIGRDQVICALAILGEEPTIIEDVTQSCYASMDAVNHFDIGFYAGTTLRTADGHALGTFCLWDYDSRAFSAADREALELYGAEVMAWIDQLGQPATEQPVATREPDQ